MTTVANLIIDTIYVFTLALKALLFARLILSWFPRLRERAGFIGGLVNVIYSLTEPILGPIRRILQKSPVGGVATIVDFSPILTYFLLELVSGLLMSVIAALF